MTMKAKAALLAVLTFTTVAIPAAANQHRSTHECTSTVGAPGTIVYASAGDVRITAGGCTLVASVHSENFLAGLIVADVQPGDDPRTPDHDCSIQSDDDSDGQSDRVLEVGMHVPEGASINAFCDTGSTNVDNAIELCDHQIAPEEDPCPSLEDTDNQTAPEDTMYLTAQPDATRTTEDCDAGTQRAYNLTDQVPTQTDPDRATASSSKYIERCPTMFSFEAEQAFTILGNAQVQATLACDLPTAAPGLEGPLGILTVWQIGVEIYKDDQQITSELFPVDEPVCAEEPIDVNVSLPVGVVDYEAGSQFTLGLVAVYPNYETVEPSVHWLVDGTEAPSAVTVPGLTDGLAEE